MFANNELGSINDIKEVLVREPRHFGAIDGLCAIFMQMKEYEKAAKAYKEMLKIFPNHSSTKQKKEMLINKSSESAQQPNTNKINESVKKLTKVLMTTLVDIIFCKEL